MVSTGLTLAATARPTLSSQPTLSASGSKAKTVTPIGLMPFMAPNRSASVDPVAVALASSELAGSLAATKTSFNAGQIAVVEISQRLDSLIESVVAYRDTSDTATRTSIAKSIASDQAAIVTALSGPEASALLKGGTTVSYATGKTATTAFETVDVAKLVAGKAIGADKGLVASLTGFTTADLDGAAKPASNPAGKSAVPGAGNAGTVLSALSAASLSTWTYSASLGSAGEVAATAAASAAEAARTAANAVKMSSSNAFYLAASNDEAAKLVAATARTQLGSRSLSIANGNPQSLLALFG